MNHLSMSAHAGTKTFVAQLPTIDTNTFTIQLLTDGDESEVLDFLAERPTHTVMLAGFIRDNGLESPLNRGSFYAWRSGSGTLEGVALVGEITTFEARTDAALAAFARCAREAPKVSVIIGEQEKVQKFWGYFAGDDQPPPIFCSELFFELRVAAAPGDSLPQLRTATSDDLDLVLAVHAEMAYEESGINPLEVDPEGFRRRCARRIEQGRVWVWIENQRLIFKADIISETLDVCYLEGIYVNHEERGKGHGFRCISQIGKTLLSRTKSVCLLVNEENLQAQRLYRKANFQLRGHYDTIFLP